MATKTFEELKQLAIQIRDEKTNKQNTATRVGTAMLEHINKLEQDYYDKTTINNRTSEYNVSINILYQRWIQFQFLRRNQANNPTGRTRINFIILTSNIILINSCHILPRQFYSVTGIVIVHLCLKCQFSTSFHKNRIFQLLSHDSI